MMLAQKVRDWQGRVLSHYQFLHLLGRGGTGEVWLVMDQRDQRQIALKLFSGILVDEDASRFCLYMIMADSPFLTGNR